MAHNSLRPAELRRAQRVPCPPYQRNSMLGRAKPLSIMVQLSDNVWRRAYTVVDTGQTYILVDGAEKLIGPNAHRRIQELMHKATGRG